VGRKKEGENIFSFISHTHTPLLPHLHILPPSIPPSLLPSQIKWEELYGALDRFSAFYTCPRFDNASTEREMKAVDSEHTNNLQDDVSEKKRKEGRREGGRKGGLL